MADILKGAAVADAICGTLAKDVKELNDKGLTPTLAIVRIGENSGDMAYERAAVKRAEKVGVKIKSCALPADISEEEFL
ncbi:MAG: bifunctional 5,10-methylene-tetrahydrofolate dehydrogenase/5,10-methylene-tetrahydrofolate cyclohydrolase, partial [Mogibacterium sp.]|nr:bifunctional 5,10-methylene-tetrahydrofolate dehydrogenase/5,10-methylene-tetrahydrofolate cyclohydrolase [Mogibacterium sp.]